MNTKIGFIGSGNMGSAIIGGIIKANLVPPTNIIASDIMENTLTTLNQTFGIETTTDNVKVAEMSDIIFLAVKPNVYGNVIKEIKENVKDDVIIVAIAAGQTISTIETHFGRDLKIVRVMPNTPALVGEGMAAISPNKMATEEDTQKIVDIFSSIGKTEIVGEYLMDVVTGISGSSPAYGYLFIEAMADAAVAEGMPRNQAYQFSAQALLGAAKMVLETGKHPGLLKDQVCSPGGTTIAAVNELEKQGFRNAVICAVKSCVDKSRDMSK